MILRTHLVDINPKGNRHAMVSQRLFSPCPRGSVSIKTGSIERSTSPFAQPSHTSPRIRSVLETRKRIFLGAPRSAQFACAKCFRDPPWIQPLPSTTVFSAPAIVSGVERHLSEPSTNRISWNGSSDRYFLFEGTVLSLANVERCCTVIFSCYEVAAVFTMY